MPRRVSSYVTKIMSIQFVYCLTGNAAEHSETQATEQPHGKGENHDVQRASKRPPLPVALMDANGIPLDLATRQDIEKLSRQIKELSRRMSEGLEQHTSPDDTEPTADTHAAHATTTRKVDDPNWTQINEAAAKLQDSDQLGIEMVIQLTAKVEAALQITKPVVDNAASQTLTSAIEGLTADMKKYAQTATNALRILNVITLLAHPQRGFVAALGVHPHETVITQAEAQEILQACVWPFVAAGVDYRTIIQQLNTTMERSPFDDKPLIPSYLVFTVFQGIAAILEPECTSLENLQRTQLRNLETIMNELNRLIEDNRRKTESAETPQSAKELLPEKGKMLQQMLSTFVDIRKELKDTGDNIAKATGKALSVIKEPLEARKDTTIFDAVTTDH